LRLNINQTTGRLFPIDLLKAISISAVVSFHSVFVPGSTYGSNYFRVDLLFAPLRFCVPVLLTISFLLLKRGLEASHKSRYPLLKKRLTRLAIPTIFWFSIAAGVVSFLVHSTLAELLISMSQGYIFRGAYYLLVLLQLVPVFIWLNSWFNAKKHIVLTMLLQCVVIVFVQASLLGIFGPDIPVILRTMGRPLFTYWFVYMALGVYIYNNWSIFVKLSERIALPLKALLLCLTCLLMMVEYKWLLLLTDGRIIPFEYMTLSSILSVLVWFLCFASVKENQLPASSQKVIQLLSKYSLGIFCINGIFSHILSTVGEHLLGGATFSFLEILVMKFIGWIFLLAVSLGLSILLARLGLKACVQ